MATRACIGVVSQKANSKTADGFSVNEYGWDKAVYHHWDGYPAGLGKTLWNLYHGYFGCDMKEMLKILIEDHPYGWSTIVQKCFEIAPIEFDRELQKKYPDAPIAYTKESDQWDDPYIYEKDDCGLEWAYLFDTNKKIMFVLKRKFNISTDDLLKIHKGGDFEELQKAMSDWNWSIKKVVNLNEKEPNWEKMETI